MCETILDGKDELNKNIDLFLEDEFNVQKLKFSKYPYILKNKDNSKM